MAVRFADAGRGQAPRWGISAAHGPSVGVTAAVAACALAAAATVSPEAVADGPVICPFRLMTGLPCPGCGLTRSWVYLLHGQPGAGTAANPVGILALLAAVALVAVVTSSVVRRRPVPTYAELIGPLRRIRGGHAIRAAGFLGLACWLGFGVVRMALAAG
jgi:hypothetical protein